MKTLKGDVGKVYVSQSGVNYTPDSTGTIRNVPDGDVGSLLAAGASFLPDTMDAEIYIPFPHAKLESGQSLPATAGSGALGLSVTPGSHSSLKGEVATSNTKTDTAIFDFVIPENYSPSTDLQMIANVQLVGNGTPGATVTIDFNAYLMNPDGTVGADLVATNAQTITTTATDYPFTISGATLNPGQMVNVVITTTVQETGGGNLNSQINSIRIK